MAAFGDAEGVPLCGDLLPADRALPLLDQARAAERGAAAGVLRRDLRAAREGEGHQGGRLGAGLVEARLGEGEGGRHQAHHAAHLRRQDRAHRRHPAALGLHRRGAKGLRARTRSRPMSATPTSRRRNTRRSWSTSSPSPGRWHREAKHGIRIRTPQPADRRDRRRSSAKRT